MNATYPSFEEIQRVHTKLSEMRTEHWLHHDLFAYQWWILGFLLIVPWLVWWRLVDTRRFQQILVYGLSLSIFVIILDDIGVELGLWAYRYQFLKLIPRLNPMDLTVLPVLHMLIYQYFPKWKTFIIANTVMALVLAFIAEPILVWLDIYEMYRWEHMYSFPIYILKAALLKWLIEKVIFSKKFPTP
jgi:hypothetical protein